MYIYTNGGIVVNTLKGRDFLKLLDFSTEEILSLVVLAERLKAMKKNGISHRWCEGKNAALIFEKTSTRTRCSFEVAARDLGMGTTYLSPDASQIGKKESIADTARVLSGMFDGIEYRGYRQERVEELAKYAWVPVWNGLTNEFHPTQILADLLTLKEQFGELEGLNFVYMGDARYNMGNSLMVGCAKTGINFTVCAPEKYYPDKKLVDTCKEFAAANGSTLTFTPSTDKALDGANAVYTDIWVSMGEPTEVWQERLHDLSPYQVNADAMAKADKNAIFMHCLPSYHDLNTEVGKAVCEKFGRTELEVTNEVFESKASVVFREAENRMHTIKAVMAATLSEDNII